MTSSDSKRYVYWCQNCSVPLLQPKCGNCGEIGIKTVSDLRPVFEGEKRLIEQFTDGVLPEQTTLLWMNRRTLWFDGQRYLRFTGSDELQVNVRYPVHTGLHNNGLDTTAEIIATANSITLRKLEDDAINFINEAVSQFSRCPQFLDVALKCSLVSQANVSGGVQGVRAFFPLSVSKGQFLPRFYEAERFR